jgi:hypothetical protein
MGELSHDARTFHGGKNPGQWRVLTERGSFVGVGQELRTQFRPRLLQSLPPGGP